MVSDQTVVRGDNTGANQLYMCYEDIETSGNQPIITPSHYNKEVVTPRPVEVKYAKYATPAFGQALQAQLPVTVLKPFRCRFS